MAVETPHAGQEVVIQCLVLALPGSSPQAPSVAGRKRCTLKGQFKEVKPSLHYA